MTEPHRVFDALGHRFTVEAWDGGVDAHLHGLFHAFAAPGHAAGDPRRYRLVDTGRGLENRFEIHRDDAIIGTNSAPAYAVEAFLWHLNRDVLATARDRYLLLHAAAAAWNDRAVVLPAAMEAGKTTFVTALVRAGLDYVTDEAVALDRQSGLVVPYPKPLVLEPGSYPLFPDLAPALPAPLTDPVGRQWNVGPEALRPGAAADAPVRAVLFVAPRYQPDGAADLEPVSPAAMVTLAADQAFEFGRLGRADLDLLADATRACPCYRISTADLDRAVAAVISALTAD